MKSHTAIKKNDTNLYKLTWTDFKDILSEQKQDAEYTYYAIFYIKIREIKIISTFLQNEL